MALVKFIEDIKRNRREDAERFESKASIGNNMEAATTFKQIRGEDRRVTGQANIGDISPEGHGEAAWPGGGCSLCSFRRSVPHPRARCLLYILNNFDQCHEQDFDVAGRSSSSFALGREEFPHMLLPLPHRPDGMDRLGPDRLPVRTPATIFRFKVVGSDIWAIRIDVRNFLTASEPPFWTGQAGLREYRNGPRAGECV